MPPCRVLGVKADIAIPSDLRMTAHGQSSRSHIGRLWNGRKWRILLKKSFRGDERNFLEPVMRFMRSDVRDHVASQKNDYGPSYRCYGTSRRRSCPEISICEIFGVVRFSTFSTVSAQSGHPQRVRERPRSECIPANCQARSLEQLGRPRSKDPRLRPESRLRDRPIFASILSHSPRAA